MTNNDIAQPAHHDPPSDVSEAAHTALTGTPPVGKVHTETPPKDATGDPADNGKQAVHDFAALLANTVEAKDRKALLQRVQLLSANLASDETIDAQEWAPTPLAFDFEAKLPRPDYVIERLVERENVVVTSGDTGSAKSITSTAILPAALAGGEWLGYATHIDRILVVDEEDNERLVKARLRALGMENAHRERLHYFSREGFALGQDSEESDRVIREQLAEFHPDLVIVNSLMAACDLSDANSNAEAVALIKYLRGLARKYHCAILLVHHERKKPREGQVASSGQEALGARQWIGQADGQMTMTVETELAEDEVENPNPTDDDPGPHRHLRRTFKWRTKEKDRDGSRNAVRRVAVESEKDSRYGLLWMTVENEGEISASASETEALAIEVAGFVGRDDEPVTTAQVAVALNRDADDGTFKRALTHAVEQGWLTKPSRGRYERGEREAPIAV